MTVCIPYIPCIPLYHTILCYWTCWPTTIVTTVASTHFNYILRVALWTFFKISCHSYHWMGVYISMIYIEVLFRVYVQGWEKHSNWYGYAKNRNNKAVNGLGHIAFRLEGKNVKKSEQKRLIISNVSWLAKCLVWYAIRY